MASSVSKVDTFLSLRNGFERFATKTDEIVRVLELELRRLLEEWDERLQKARYQERERQSDLSDAQRDLRWCEGTGDGESTPNCSYEQARVERAKRSLTQAQAHLQSVSRSAREIQMACEAFQKHGRALRTMATQTAPSASSQMNILLRDIERASFIAPAQGNGQASSGGIAVGVPPPNTSLPEQTFEHSGTPTNAASQSRRSYAVRGLTALLSGQFSSTKPSETTQIALAGQKLRSIPELTPTVWNTLSEPQRIAVLCSIERVMAELQGRHPLPVVVEGDDLNIYGGYAPRRECIFLRRQFVIEADSRAIAGAIIHTGRHAYQAYAMRHSGFHSNEDEVGRWRINNLYYLHADTWGDEAYRNQPVERDAFAYTEAIMRQMDGEGDFND